MQILCLPATSSEKQEPRWIEFVDTQITLKVLWALTTAVSVPDLHTVLLLRDGVDPIIRLAAIPVVVVIGGAICPLKVTLLTWGKRKKAVTTELWLQRVGGPIPCSPHPHPQWNTAQGHGQTPLSKVQTVCLGFTTGMPRTAQVLQCFPRESPESKSIYFLSSPPSSAFLFLFIFHSFSSIYKKIVDTRLISWWSLFFFLTYWTIYFQHVSFQKSQSITGEQRNLVIFDTEDLFSLFALLGPAVQYSFY